MLNLNAFEAEVQCASCGTMNQTLNAFCGACGVAIKGQIAPATSRTSPRSSPYRGPRRLLIAGAFCVLLGTPAAIVSFSTVQGKGVSGFLFDIAVPAINVGLEIAGLEQIQNPIGGGASMVFVVVFVLGFMLAALGAFLLLLGAIWMLARSSVRARAQEAYRRTQPVASHVAETSQRQLSTAVVHGRGKLVTARPKILRAVRSIGRKGRGSTDRPA